MGRRLTSVVVKGRIARALGAGIYQLLGAALLTPVAVALGLAILAELTVGRVLVLWAACLPASVLIATVPLVQRIEAAALEELLGVEVPERADRLYLVALTSLHLYGGATLGAGVQRGDRRDAVRVDGDGQDARPQRPGQARRPRPHPGGRPRLRAGPRLPRHRHDLPFDAVTGARKQSSVAVPSAARTLL